MESFRVTKNLFKTAFKKILCEGDSYEIGEAALPAYAHKNPLIDWLFWERVKIAYKFVLTKNPSGKVLDFGCGSGVVSYMLAKKGIPVVACDLEFGPLQLVKSKIEFPSDISFIEGDILSQNLKDDSFDVILALDVLEHIDHLEPYITLFNRLLAPNGVLLISGPTENLFYKIGRKMAGNRFTGDYHLKSISTIKDLVEKQMNVVPLKKLLPPVVLFEIFTSHKKIPHL